MGGFGGPEWNVKEVGDSLFGRPQFAGKMSFGPEYHYDIGDTTRLFENPWTADASKVYSKTYPLARRLVDFISPATRLCCQCIPAMLLPMACI